MACLLLAEESMAVLVAIQEEVVVAVLQPEAPELVHCHSLAHCELQAVHPAETQAVVL